MGRPAKGTATYALLKMTKGFIVSEEFVIRELSELFTRLIKDKELIFPEEILENKHYTYKELVEWSKSFSEKRPEIVKITTKIQEILLGRVKNGVISAKIPATFIKFILQTEFSYSDRSETVVSHTIDSELSQDKRELLNTLLGMRENLNRESL